MSKLAHDISHLGNVLRARAVSQIREHSTQFANIPDFYRNQLSHVIIQKWDAEEAIVTAKELFGKTKLRYAAIDGTERTDPTFDLMIFYGGAYAALGTIDLEIKEPIQSVSIDPQLTTGGVGVAACIPVYISEIPEIELARLKFSHEKEDEEARSVNDIFDETVIDNSQIANDIMLLAEIRLGETLAKTKNYDVIILDRYLAGTHANLLAKTVGFNSYEQESSLIGLDTEFGEVTKADLWFNRYRPFNKNIGIPPPRGEYLSHRIFFELEQREELSLGQFIREFGLTDSSKVISRVKRAIELLEKNEVVTVIGEGREAEIILSEDYKQSFARISAVKEAIVSRLFDLENEDTNPLRIEVRGEKRWLTTVDLALLSLFSFNSLVQEAQTRPFILIGITKDTYSRDFRNQFLNFLNAYPNSPVKIDMKTKMSLPQTDRGLLQAVSHVVLDELHPPWATQEYDTAFRTMGPKKGEVWPTMSGSHQNIILSERLFIKSFIQLREGRTNPELRSTVLMTDRVVIEEDLKHSINLPGLIHHYRGIEERVYPLVMPANNKDNPVQNLIMRVLTLLDAPSIPEAMGHNKPLFVADKVCKWFGEVFGSIVSSTRQWMETHREIRSYAFHLTSFREKRTDFEQTRKG